MDFDSISQGWLVVSNSIKRRLKSTGAIRKGRRFPLGDKGLGRLGAQRLAENVEIVSNTSSDVEHQIGFSWSEFSKHGRLSEVPIKGPTTRPKQKNRPKHGTSVVLSGLVDPSRWQGPVAKADLEERFAELISPFESIERFDLAVTVDGVKLDPARVAKKVRNEADATFSISFDGSQINFGGKVKLQELEPSGDRKRVFNTICDVDNGEQLLAFLQEAAKESGIRIYPAGGAWFVRFALSINFQHLDKLILLPDGEPANPGPVRAEVDTFDLGRQRTPSAFSTAKEFKKLIKSLWNTRR